MKTISKLALALSAALAFAMTNALADSQPIFMSIASPDHPQTWVVGANQQSKHLRWDSIRHLLVADVKYSNAEYADSANPARTDDRILTFPSVRLARNGVDLRATNHLGETATIGHIKDGLFGKEVVLNKNVDFRVHRVAGAIHASLVYNALVKE